MNNHLWELQQEIDQRSNQESDRMRLDRLEQEVRELKISLENLKDERTRAVQDLSSRLSLVDWPGLGPWFETRFSRPLVKKVEFFTLREPEAFKISAGRRPAFPLEHRFYSSYALRIENRSELGRTRDRDGERDSGAQNNPLRAKLECDGDIIYDAGFIFTRERRTRVYEFDWYNNNENGQKVQVRFDPSVNRCVFQFREYQDKSWTYAVEMAALDQLSPIWMDLTRNLEVCARPTGFGTNDPVAFFWEQDFTQVTCPQTYEKLDMLRDPYKAFNAKIRGLTGRNIDPQILQNKDPEANLNFSKAPEFDVIWVSSLNFSADFYGSTLAHALRYHGEHGTQIRILVPTATTTKKDLGVLNALTRGLPNVKVQMYEYNLTNGRDGSWLDEFHRVMHAKLLIGYSTKNPKDSFVVTGGRNIRDSYLFHDKPSYRKYPWLKDYAGGEEAFIYYDDFEIEMRGQPLVRSILSQMMSLWNRDPVNQLFRSTNLNLPSQAPDDQRSRLRALPSLHPLVRHVLSLPYVDGSQLEKFYIQAFDSAQKEILLTTPYFRPSDALSAAFDRAAKRGVKIKVLTRIQLAGDGTPKIAEDVNKKGINRHLKDLEIYEWTDPKSILHAKLMVIDSKLSFVSSVNMNRRSFLHDVESGALILHEKTALELREEILDYFTKASRVTEERKIKWLNGMLIDWADDYF